MLNEKTLTIKYQSYSKFSDLPEPDQSLLHLARSVLKSAYAPYSRFFVAAAVRLQTSEVLVATNQENASYGLSLCAEQNVLAHAGSTYWDVPIEALSVTVDHQVKDIAYPISPCGACRQVIREHEARHQHPIRIVLQGNSGNILIFNTIEDLLPFAFSPKDLIG